MDFKVRQVSFPAADLVEVEEDMEVMVEVAMVAFFEIRLQKPAFLLKVVLQLFIASQFTSSIH